MASKSQDAKVISLEGHLMDDSLTQGKYPKISIVTPSFNSVEFIEETILSVICQGYPNIEYIIIDGGSTDGTVEIIKKYSSSLFFWVSEPDKGQSDAINKGFSHATGEIFGWINADDFLAPRSLWEIAEVWKTDGFDWLVGVTAVVDINGGFIRKFYPKKNPSARMEKLHVEEWIQIACGRWFSVVLPQPSSFWSEKAWTSVGGLDNKYHFIMDNVFFTRLSQLGFSPKICSTILAVFRSWDNQKSASPISFAKEKLNFLSELISLSKGRDQRILIKFFIHQVGLIIYLAYINMFHQIKKYKNGLVGLLNPSK